ncbi:phage Gp37/Gp68 family protein [Bradyrhizobium sp. 4]|uniref:phage Gp37/Gp68 family protein n=1 Tax=unclassified Bradyrhizobium TaxID=2631580 RepID=UPI001FF8960E|nr:MULTISPECIES: phage Gp37/Gp68 family protein [unclassified Bradyrhizobium]MCK1402000.1 phage Gp37/Gp68 family protein [Bradyrhizobium sp. 39]MCK1751280.1 phage Gp37/Gp68 family protein [Bradyrhizobium sp. 135]UPJ38530.1 phage Gp37/Gp68 family protein [Bradyrhizobium sp. 4]
MSDNSKIEWTDATWNPITGCTILSPGCAHCYAMKLAGTRLRSHPSRAGLTNGSKTGPVWNGQVRFNGEWLCQPLEWKRPRNIFVCAHGDLFHESVPDEWIDQVFAVMALAKHHTFQVLTKRAQRMRKYLGDFRTPTRIVQAMRFPIVEQAEAPSHIVFERTMWPLSNVWLGVSAERQEEANERIPYLLATPAAVRFVSLEPLLGPIHLGELHPGGGQILDALSGLSVNPAFSGWSGLDWVIVGGESGDGARPMHPAWPRAIEADCAVAGVAFHFKQWGAWVPICATTEEFTDTLYHPAPQRNPDASRRCKVDQMVLHADGTQFRDAAEPLAYAGGSGAMLMFEVGKKRAGRLLDGIEHNGIPGRAA